MRSPFRTVGSGILLAFAACNAAALGFGRDTHASNLGQPLDFTVPLRFDADEFVSSECISAEVIAGESRIPPSDVRVSLRRIGSAGEHALRITTSSLIGEPIVDINVGVGCPVRLSRRFVAFIDPPQINLAEAPAPLAAETASEAPAAAPTPPPGAFPPSASAPLAAASPAAEPPARPARKPRPARAVSRPPAKRPPAAEPPAARPASEAATRTAAAPPAPAGGARLQLEAPELLARAPAPPASSPAASASAQAAASAASAAAPAAVDPATALARQAAEAIAATLPADQAAARAQAAREQERIRLLEASLAKLTEDTKATQDSVATLQARLRDAEAGRYANPLVYALAAAVALLLLMLAALLWWMRDRQRRRDAWWAASAEEAEQRGRSRAVQERAADVPPAATEVPVAEVIAGAPPPPTGPVTWKPTAAIPELDTRDVPRRAVSAEELIDLEQQAEFFVTLGQDDAAIALLDSHIGTAGGVSPMPYLKLLDIHRRRSDPGAYEDVRQQFNQRFNGYAPAWDAPAGTAQPLEERAHVMAKIQDAWATPPRVMGVLEQMLFRATPGEAAFDLEAYRDVLFLYEVARDLAEHQVATSSVDLELPIGPEFEAFAVVAHPLRSTMPVVPNPDLARPLTIDLDLDALLVEEEVEAQSANQRSGRFEEGRFTLSDAGAPADEPAERPRLRSTRY